MLTDLAKLIEVFFFLENEPISMQHLTKLTSSLEEDILLAIEELSRTYSDNGHGLEIVERGGNFQIEPNNNLYDTLRIAYGRKVDKRLSKAALETLSIIAYAQPVTRRDVENIRGVSSDSIMRVLLEREYIRGIGKKDVPGRPMLYGTTKKFLIEFNLPSISALPKLSEIDKQRFLTNEEGITFMKIEYPIRLQSYLAKSGFGSRRSCEQLIADGRVSVNLQKIREMGVKVNEEDVVMVDDVLAEASDKTLYYALNKPKGYVCTNYDPNESSYARDLITIADKNLLFHVGRLDKESSGLILYTNDGDMAQKITHPSFQIEKEYAVLTSEPIRSEDLQRATKGLFIDSQKPYTIKNFTITTKKWAHVTLTEGRNRELRKIFTYLGYNIVQLVRLRIGSITLGSLKEGQFRAVSKSEIQSLLEENKQ